MKEIDFKDRIPTYPGRVVLSPVEGKANTYTMTRADEPTEEGTPIGKAAFESIIQSRLTGRYYVPNFTKSEIGNYEGITTNPIPSTWYKETSDRATSGVWVVSSSSNDNSEVFRAFDGNIATRWIAAPYTSAELIIDTGNVLTVKKMLIHTEAINGSYTNFNISGSNNGVDWVTLHTLASVPTTETEITLTTTGAFKLYRLSFELSLSNVSASVWEWAFTDYDVKTYSNIYTIENGVPGEWTEGQKITIQTPVNADTLAVVNCSLNGIPIDTILLPNMRYELCYTGTIFVAKVV